MLTTAWNILISVYNELRDIEREGKLLDLQQFPAFAQRHQALLFPAFQMQFALRKTILGNRLDFPSDFNAAIITIDVYRFWEASAIQRAQISKGGYLPIEKYVDLVTKTT